MIHDDIRSLLEAPPTGEEAPTLDHIEHTLTAGYAQALALEAERWRLERKIADVAARLGDEVTDEGTTVQEIQALPSYHLGLQLRALSGLKGSGEEVPGDVLFAAAMVVDGRIAGDAKQPGGEGCASWPVAG